MKKTTIPGIMLVVAVLTTGCNKADNSSMGPAQEAGKAVDDAGANVARETREGVERADQATERAGDNLQRAGAEVRQESRAAAQDAKRGMSNVTEATGKSIERAGERIQDAAK